jgi:hypothetical protein
MAIIISREKGRLYRRVWVRGYWRKVWFNRKKEKKKC